jgi:hypothetical protein
MSDAVGVILGALGTAFSLIVLSPGADTDTQVIGTALAVSTGAFIYAAVNR